MNKITMNCHKSIIHGQTRGQTEACGSEITVHLGVSCRKNPGPGAWAAIVVSGDRQKVLSDADLETTNNRLTLSAAIGAIKHIRGERAIRVVTSSRYIVDGMNLRMPEWRRAGFDGVKNADLWAFLDMMAGTHDITFDWLSGASGNRGLGQAAAVAKDTANRL
jgi:ribonuclease HI